MHGANARLLLLLLAGALVGSIVNELLLQQFSSIPPAITNYLEIGFNRGRQATVTIDLWVFSVTLGMTLKLCLLSIVGMGLGVYVYRRWT